MASADFTVNIVMLINITINKTLDIYDSVKKLFWCKYCHGDKYYY